MSGIDSVRWLGDGTEGSMDDGYPRFSDGEVRRRSGLVRELMAREGVEALLLHGSPSAVGPVHYLSGYLAWRPTWLLFALEGPSTLYLHFHNHVPNARALRSEEHTS